MLHHRMDGQLMTHSQEEMALIGIFALLWIGEHLALRMISRGWFYYSVACGMEILHEQSERVYRPSHKWCRCVEKQGFLFRRRCLLHLWRVCNVLVERTYQLRRYECRSAPRFKYICMNIEAEALTCWRINGIALSLCRWWLKTRCDFGHFRHTFLPFTTGLYLPADSTTLLLIMISAILLSSDSLQLILSRYSR